MKYTNEYVEELERENKALRLEIKNEVLKSEARNKIGELDKAADNLQRIAEKFGYRVELIFEINTRKTPTDVDWESLRNKGLDNKLKQW